MAQLGSSLAAIFLDDGGVMNDNTLRGPQWQRLVGEYLSPRLGGERPVWAEANRIVAERQWATFDQRLSASGDFAAFAINDERDWLREMCAIVGVRAPADDDACLALSRDTSAYVTRRVRAAYPGVVEAIRWLHSQGHTLHTASGGSSRDLEGCLEGMGVRPLFAHLYGPDLVNTPKNGSLFYQRIFADAGVDPPEALVVDDRPMFLSYAAEAGARTVLVSADGASGEGHTTIKSLAELPALLRDLSASSRLPP